MLTVRLLISAQFSIKGGNIGAAGAFNRYMFDNTGVIVFKEQTLTIFLKFCLMLKLMFVMSTEEEGNIVIYTEAGPAQRNCSAKSSWNFTIFNNRIRNDCSIRS
ncbi:hypothetical protein KCP71_02790 [Salmonella enterica subsp. enterica]|nr:hypothetical protein KCP71_02790 [Salmonella enterica subsp. enterica]